MPNQYETNTTTTMTTSKKASKKQKTKSKAHKKATAHKHNSNRLDRKQRAQFLKAFEQMLSIDRDASAAIFQVGMMKKTEKKGIKMKNKIKGKQACQAVRTPKKSRRGKPFVLTFQPPTFVLDQDLQEPLTFHPLTFGRAPIITPTFGRAPIIEASGEESGLSFAVKQRAAYFYKESDQDLQEPLTFHPPTFGRAPIIEASGEESGLSFAEKQRVAHFRKESDTWTEDTCIVGVPHDAGVDQPCYTIPDKQSGSEEPIETQTSHDR